jgi:hypothetical protein
VVRPRSESASAASGDRASGAARKNATSVRQQRIKKGIKRLLSRIRKAKSIKLYEGLPRQRTEEENRQALRVSVLRQRDPREEARCQGVTGPVGQSEVVPVAAAEEEVQLSP